MNIKPYWNYFKYVMEHKKNVFIECWSAGLYWRALTHDLSKFSRAEFVPYARYFYIDKEKYKDEFEKAWEHHYKTNKHHWDGHVIKLSNNRNKWIRTKMELTDIKEMICDWKAMSRKFGDTAQEYYLSNYYKMEFNPYTRYMLELYLGLLEDVDLILYKKDNHEHWTTLGELASNRSREQFESLIPSLIENYPKLDIYKSLSEWEC